MGGDLGAFTDKSDVYVIDLETKFIRQTNRVTQEDVAFGAFPLGIAGGEVTADVALCQTPIYSVCEGVKPDICVGMALQPTTMGDGDTAEHTMVAGAEAVDVKT